MKKRPLLDLTSSLSDEEEFDNFLKLDLLGRVFPLYWTLMLGRFFPPDLTLLDESEE